MVRAKCYFCCKPHCNSNNMRNMMKVELTTVPRPPASPGRRSQSWAGVDKRVLDVPLLWEQGTDKADTCLSLCVRREKGRGKQPRNTA